LNENSVVQRQIYKNCIDYQSHTRRGRWLPASFVLCAKELSSEQVSEHHSEYSDLVIVPVASEAMPFSRLSWIQLVIECVFDATEANESL
jgi:hypothetical protein